MSESSDRAPVPDQAESDAWFPSPFSLTQYVPPKTDFDGADYPNAYKGGKWRILLIATQERYLRMAGGEFFSTGNHPVEMLLPVLHLDAAGFEIDIATISGDPVKFEIWAFPKEDEAVKGIFEKYKEKLRAPLNLQDVWGRGFHQRHPVHRSLHPRRARRTQRRPLLANGRQYPEVGRRESALLHHTLPRPGQHASRQCW